MSEVIPLFPGDRDAAWARYEAKARELADKPALISDRAFMESLWAAEREAKRLYFVHMDSEAAK